MSTNTSQNLGLHLWEPTDQVLRTEFNQNWQKIDTAVDTAQQTAEAAQDTADAAQTAASAAFTPTNMPYVTGTYTGDGTTTNRTITLGFKPKFVIISGMSRGSNESSDSLYWFGMFGEGNVSSDIGTLTNSGFTVRNSSYTYPKLNNSNCEYSYIAFR